MYVQSMWVGYAGFVALAINPFGGLVFAIPYAKTVLHVSPYLAALVGWPLAYVQVLFVDLLWKSLWRITWWRNLIERKRSPRLQRLAASPTMFWTIFFLGGFIGPWLVMAIMRYANVPHRRIAIPIALNLGWNAFAVAVITVYAPRLLPK